MHSVGSFDLERKVLIDFFNLILRNAKYMSSGHSIRLLASAQCGKNILISKVWHRADHSTSRLAENKAGAKRLRLSEHYSDLRFVNTTTVNGSPVPNL